MGGCGKIMMMIKMTVGVLHSPILESTICKQVASMRLRQTGGSKSLVLLDRGYCASAKGKS